MDQTLCAILESKIDEQIERSDHLTGLLPRSALDWTPAIPGAFSGGILLGHLLECLAGFCAVLYAVHPDELRRFEDLRRLPTNHRCDTTEARERIAGYRARIHEGFRLLRDEDLVS